MIAKHQEKHRLFLNVLSQSQEEYLPTKETPSDPLRLFTHEKETNE
jgi:hypothetical protein